MRADVENLQTQVVEQITPRVQGLESRGHGLELKMQSPEFDGKGNSFGLLEVRSIYSYLNSCVDIHTPTYFFFFLGFNS